MLLLFPSFGSLFIIFFLTKRHKFWISQNNILNYSRIDFIFLNSISRKAEYSVVENGKFSQKKNAGEKDLLCSCIKE
jgi:hypothetical protein